MAERKKLDIATIPNALTLTRLFAAPKVMKKLEENPRKYWLPAGIFIFSDIVDGKLTKLGTMSALMAKLGFRQSEFGRLADPVSDKFAIGLGVIAGLRNGVIPRPLAALALTQKAAISAHSLYNYSRGAEVHVTKLGKRSEFITNVGLGTLFSWESADDPNVRSTGRTVSSSIALVGMVGAVIADIGYAQQARTQRLEQ